MSERIPTMEKREKVPSPEEVQAVFDTLVEGKEYTNDRELSDERGLYLRDITLKTDDGTIEYSYMRKGRYPQGEAKITAIHVTFYDPDGMPVGGHSVAKYMGDQWNITR